MQLFVRWAMNQYLSYYENKSDENAKLEIILFTPDHPGIGHSNERDLSHCDKIKDKRKYLPFCPEKKSHLEVILITLWMKWRKWLQTKEKVI